MKLMNTSDSLMKNGLLMLWTTLRLSNIKNVSQNDPILSTSYIFMSTFCFLVSTFCWLVQCVRGENLSPIFPRNCFLNLIFWHIQINKAKEKADKHRLLSILAEAKGFEPLCPLRQTVFKTASLWPLRYASVCFFHSFFSCANVKAVRLVILACARGVRTSSSAEDRFDTPPYVFSFVLFLRKR